MVAPQKVVNPVPSKELVARKPDRKLSDQISLELNTPPTITPPGAQALLHPTPPILQLTSQSYSQPRVERDGDVSMKLAWTSGKRNRVEPFDQMVSKAPPLALPKLATSNYFSVLATMEVEIEEIKAIANPENGDRVQIIPMKARMPKEVATSKEAAHFYQKRHTTIKKSERPTRVGEIGELMEIDSKNALHSLRPDKLVQADACIHYVRKLVQFCTNPDKIIRAALDHPITMNGVLLACMESNDKALDEVAHLLMINRVFATHNLGEDVTFATRWSRHVGGKVPSKRSVLFEKVMSWWTSVPDIVIGLTRATKALALLELLFMCTSPTFYTNDHCIQYLTDGPVIWIPGHHCRLLPTNVIISFFRSDVGIKCWSQWFGGRWRGLLHGDIAELSVNLSFFPEEHTTLHLSQQDGEMRLITGPLQREC